MVQKTDVVDKILQKKQPFFYGFSWIGCVAVELCNRCGGQIKGMNFGIEVG
ncbi:MAG: hypothetical protein MUO63_07255 [Desulfobulbaceae bacterium]|nr:hypothetical protein [Desulfobulbaceae bacterium]